VTPLDVDGVGVEGMPRMVSRILGRVTGPASGPTLVALGGLHGNETAGIVSLERVLAALAGRLRQHYA